VLYRVAPFQIDLQIEAKPGHDRVVVTGQVLDMGRPEKRGNSVRENIGGKELNKSLCFRQFANKDEWSPKVGMRNFFAQLIHSSLQ